MERAHRAGLKVDRLRLVGAGRASTLERFGRDVRAGFASAPKSLPCEWIYDAEGSRLFEEICELAEYYPTRAETEILRERADEIARGLPAELSVVELGSGNATKTRLLLGALLRRRGQLLYAPVDISRSMLEKTARALLEDYPALEVLAVAAEYREALPVLRSEVDGPKLVLWLGSNVGNLHRGEAAAFLKGLRGSFAPDDRFLIGVDLRKDRETLVRAYDDARGVTARFNKNLLARINRELGGGFDLAAFGHRALWREAEGRIEMHLESLRAQTVRVEALDLWVAFKAGERVHTENSYKYSFAELDELAAAGGFEVEARWLDRAGRFALLMLAPVHQGSEVRAGSSRSHAAPDA